MDDKQFKEMMIRNLTSDLESSVSEIGDWKIAKYNEYVAAGIDAPYDIHELYEKREAVREQIRQLRKEIEEMEDEDGEI